MINARINKILHKWLSLFVGLQLLVWLVTGLYFNLMDHEKGSGNINKQPITVTKNASDFELFAVEELNIDTFSLLQLVWINELPYYLVSKQETAHRYQAQKSQLFNAVDGEPFSLNQNTALNIARKSYTLKNPAKEVTFLSPPIADLPKERNSVWQVSMNDSFDTDIYISAVDGQVIAHVTNDKRLKDFMFMLHFMDYSKTGSFNHGLIILFALLTLTLSFTGLVWLIELIKRRKFKVDQF